MFDHLPSTSSPHLNEQSPADSDFRPYESFEAQNQQDFAASNTLCSLRHHQQPRMFEPAFSGDDTDGGLDGLHTPSSDESTQNLSWSESQLWIQPSFQSAAPYLRDVWSFNGIGNSTSFNPSMYYPVLPSYANPGYGLAPTSWSSNPDQMSTLPEPTARLQHGPEKKFVAEVINDSSATDGPDEKMHDETYAKLIERALLEASGNRLTLKGIYKWFEQNTSKAKDPENKGWQNSVRHNLSMNGAFTKIPLAGCSNGSQKGSFWVLEPSAKVHGIQSTTRFRPKNTSNRKKSLMNVHRTRSEIRVRRASQKSVNLGMNFHAPQGSTSHWGQQQPAPLISIPVGYAQPYLPSPYFRPTSSNDSFSDVSGDCTSMDSEPAVPFAPYPQVHLGPAASPALIASAATQPTRYQPNPYC